MRVRMLLWTGMLVLGSGGFVALSLSHGQVSPPPAQRSSSPPDKAEPAKPAPDFSKLPPLQRQLYLSAQRGADWLRRANRPDGRFVYGYLPALHKPLEGDHYLRQVGAAFALARAARFTGDDRCAAVARQAILTLLLDTATDPDNPALRSTTLPSAVVNRLAAAGLLVLAINELPSPGDDLQDQSEQLCAFIARQQQEDGALRYADAGADPKAAGEDPDGINYYPGEALYGLMHSQAYRPAAWKTDVVRKALAYYRPWWQAHKNMAFVPWHTAAYTEAYLLTKEQPFADCVNEMTDWVCGLQYTMLDPRHPLWAGGFMGWVENRPAPVAPQVASASYAEGLADACRVARQAGDLPRYQRYREALERCLLFLTTLQYTEANTTHFADWYRPVLVGAFHASHEESDLRISATDFRRWPSGAYLATQLRYWIIAQTACCV